ncbi:MAG: bifunctional precorrin-2 dehydrogenase/sirohydrochlorin ferrochelatase [Lewinella sp.]|nr:bifunctional precorrin-2 dehydrogenase/sirohydrochlorin ferrochelatase [Lewinella sp.]
MDNPLYPLFCRLDNLRILVVGAGEVGEEKLRFILKSSPNAQVTIVAPWMGEDLRELLNCYPVSEGGQTDGAWLLTHAGVGSGCRATGHHHGGQERPGRVVYLARPFVSTDVAEHDLIIAATNLPDVNRAVYSAAKEYRRLVNVADTPDLCDFYLGSVVTRGPLKVAISTNGQSPTFAKRFRQWLEAALPDQATPELLDRLQAFRDQLSGDFRAKVLALNELTAGLLLKPNNAKQTSRTLHKD